MRKVIFAPLVLVLAASAACGGTGGSNGGSKATKAARPDKSQVPTFDRAGLEQAVGAKLTAMQGQASKTVSCPQKLQVAAKATTQCTLTTTEGATLPVTATVASIRGGNVDLDVASPWVSKALLNRLLFEELRRQVTPGPKAVNCPKDLTSTVKATLTCTLTTTEDDNHPINVTVTSVDNQRTEFDWSVNS